MELFNSIDCRLSFRYYRRVCFITTNSLSISNIYFPFDFLIVIFVILHAILLGTFDKTSKYLMFVVVALFVYIGVGSVYSLPIFHAKTYQNQLQLNQKS